MSVNELLRITIDQGGGTFDRYLRPMYPETGFSVGITEGTFDILPLDDLEGLNEAISRLLAEFPLANIGTWVHDGSIHLDPVLTVDDRLVATNLALGLRQKAIYNFETGETINV